MADRSHSLEPGVRASTTTRRSLVKGMAWAAPAMLVSTAAPAINASLLTCVTLDWSTFPIQSGSKLQNGGSVTLGGAPVTVSLSGRTNHADTYTRNAGALRLRSDNGLTVSAADTLQTLTIAFGAPVRHVSLRVYDLDQDIYDLRIQQFRDEVYIPAGAAAPTSVTRGADVIGAGTPGDRFRAREELMGDMPGRPDQEDAAKHGVVLEWDGPLTEIQLAYVQGLRRGNFPTPTIWISNVDFCV